MKKRCGTPLVGAVVYHIERGESFWGNEKKAGRDPGRNVKLEGLLSGGDKDRVEGAKSRNLYRILQRSNQGSWTGRQRGGARCSAKPSEKGGGKKKRLFLRRGGMTLGCANGGEILLFPLTCEGGGDYAL